MTLLWRRHDLPGMEACRLVRHANAWRIEGDAVFSHDGVPCRVTYAVECDDSWHAQSAHVSAWIGDQSFEVQLERGWSPELADCIDLDLNFSPCTNTLPIRRLNLAIGASAEVSAAWLRFPSLKLERLEQRYTRLADRTYLYESREGSFVAELEVDEEGMVVRYGDFWSRV